MFNLSISLKSGKIIKSTCDNFAIINGFLKVESGKRTGYFNTNELVAFESTKVEPEIEEKKK